MRLVSGWLPSWRWCAPNLMDEPGEGSGMRLHHMNSWPPKPTQLYHPPNNKYPTTKSYSVRHKSYCFLPIYSPTHQRVNSVDESVVLSRFVIHRYVVAIGPKQKLWQKCHGNGRWTMPCSVLGFRYKMVRVKFLCLSVLHNLIGPVVYEISEDGATEPICFVGCYTWRSF